VTPENVAELAGAMEAQAGEPGLDAAGAAALHEKVARVFSLERLAGDVLRLYGDLLS
jgi:hypothetical protein